MSSILDRRLRLEGGLPLLNPGQIRQGQLLHQFEQGLAEPSALVAMTAASFAYRLSKIMMMQASVQLGLSRFVPSLVLQGTAVAVSTAAEVSVYRLLAVPADSHSWWADCAHFSFLKAGMALGQGSNPILSNALEDVAFVAGDRVIQGLGLSSGASEAWLDQFALARVSNVQMKAGMGIARGLLPALTSWEQSQSAFAETGMKSSRSLRPFSPSIEMSFAAEANAPLDPKTLNALWFEVRRGNREAFERIEKAGETSNYAVYILRCLMIDGHPRALAALGRLSIRSDDALEYLLDQALGGNQKAVAILTNAALTNVRMAKHLAELAEQGNEHAFEMLERLARENPSNEDLLDHLHYLGTQGMEPAVRVLTEIVTEQHRYYDYMERFAINGNAIVISALSKSKNQGAWNTLGRVAQQGGTEAFAWIARASSHSLPAFKVLFRLKEKNFPGAEDAFAASLQAGRFTERWHAKLLEAKGKNERGEP